MNYSDILAKRNRLKSLRDRYDELIINQENLIAEKITETTKFILDHHLAINEWNKQKAAGYPEIWSSNTVSTFEDLERSCDRMIEGFYEDARAVWAEYDHEYFRHETKLDFPLMLIEDDVWREQFAEIHHHQFAKKAERQRQLDLAQYERLRAILNEPRKEKEIE